MERKISLSDIKKAVESAYEKVKSCKDGEVDSRLSDADDKKFGISVCLTDGTIIEKADTDVASPLGSIVKIPVFSILLQQNGVDGIIKKSGQCSCSCNPHKKPRTAVSAHGVRAVSAIEPTGDPDSKWNFIENQMIGLMGSAPILDDKLYQDIKNKCAEEKAVNAFANSGYYLYDDAATSIDLLARAESMKATTTQLAIMGATIAADGVNPVNNQIVFDGALSQRIVAMMAAKGPHKMNLPWLLASGIPAKSSFGGAMVGVIPGVLSIAAYAPKLNEKGISVKAANAIIEFMNELDLSAFSSAKVEVVK